MPLWRIFSHSSTFNTAQKQALAQSITQFYTRGGSGLPAFYVDIVFIPVERDSFYVGGKQTTNMVRIAIEHIAIHQPKQEDDTQGVRARMLVTIDELLAPHIAARGNLDWEYHVLETPRDLWKIQGIAPPPFRSSEEKVWARENKATPWENTK
ncbi:hypothetical protein MMC07_003465 [Pseudocyphellaria aurata]|nr:hypothetical protein [Pseudocyphellaria aurata]